MSRIPDHIDLLQQLLDNMTDHIFFKDNDSRFILMNKADSEWLGFASPQEAVGKTDFDLFRADFAAIARADELRIMECGEPLTGKEEKQTWPDGSVTWVTTSKIPLRDKKGHIIGIIGIGRNITRLKQKELELEEANRKLKEANHLISEDLSMAARLQQTFLPQIYPLFLAADGSRLLEFSHVYEANSTVGGDFCSVHKLSGTKAGLLICDVMGHGVRAALVTSMIKTLTDNLARQTESPGRFLSEMNRQLHPLLQTEDTYLFATACFLTIDTATGILEGAIAGHPLPFLIQAHSKQVCLLEQAEAHTGPALAVTSDHEYQPFAVGLTPGDTVLMYTDGLYEVLDSNRSEFGVPRLRQAIQERMTLPLQELLPDLVQAARDYSGNRIHDDVCLTGFTVNALNQSIM